MQKYNIRANLICTTEQLYEKATNEIQMNGSMGEWFITSQSKAWTSFVNHPHQHFFQTDHV